MEGTISTHPTLPLRILHRIGAVLSLVLIVGFWVLSIWGAISTQEENLIRSKEWIAIAMFALVPFMVFTTISGMRMAPYLTGLYFWKRRKAKWIALLGALVLVPSAIALAWLAHHGDFGIKFIVLQMVEMLGGIANLVLMHQNMRFGRMLRLRREFAQGLERP